MTLSHVQVWPGPDRNLSASSGQAPTRISAQQVDAQTPGEEHSPGGMSGQLRPIASVVHSRVSATPRERFPAAAPAYHVTSFRPCFASGLTWWFDICLTSDAGFDLLLQQVLRGLRCPRIAPESRC